jgi:hypothetical protein
MTLISIGEVTIPKNYLYLLINRSLSIDKITSKKEQMPRAPCKDSKKIVCFFYFFQLFFTTIFTDFLVDAKGHFLSESEIDVSNCQIHMPNHYLKFEIFIVYGPVFGNVFYSISTNLEYYLYCKLSSQ